MESKNNNTFGIWLIGIVVLVLIAMLGYIFIYDRFKDNSLPHNNFSKITPVVTSQGGGTPPPVGILQGASKK